MIMPCYNSQETIERSVQSVLNQSLTDFELIIVNDGSVDRTPEILERMDDKRIKIIFQKNSGVCVARNMGFNCSKGNYTAFIDSDDTWDSSFLEIMVSALEKDSTAVLAYCGWQNINKPNSNNEPFIPKDYESPKKLQELMQGCKWPIHAALTRRTAIEKAGGFDIRFSTSEDYLLWLKIATVQKIVRIKQVLAFYYFHDTNQTSKTKQNAP